MWPKGPVYHHAGVRLNAAGSPVQRWYTLSMDGMQLSGIIGHWDSSPAGCRPIDENDTPLPLEGRA